MLYHLQNINVGLKQLWLSMNWDILLDMESPRQVRYYKNILLKKKPIRYGMDFESAKANNMTNGKGKNSDNAISVDASYNCE